MDTSITHIKAREILDSRGNPTVEADVTLRSGKSGRAACPSGASTGVHEAVELRDGEKRFRGMGVQKAVHAINAIIAPALIGIDAKDQVGIDSLMKKLDGTPNKSRFGANAILTVSMAVARVAAVSQDLALFQYLGKGPYVLPVPCMNIMNGGAHANWQGSDFQEYMIAATGAPSLPDAIRWGSEVYHSLKSVLKKKDLSTGVGDEGGFAPKVSSNHEPADLICKAIEDAGYSPGKEISLVLDPASSSFFENDRYLLRTEKKELYSGEMTDYYRDMIKTYPIISIEDGLSEDDWDGWSEMTKALGSKIQIVGDDLFVTNPERIERGIKEKSANAVLIKLNQIGTVTETIQAVDLAKSNHWGAMVSHRSGETSDSFIADLSVALSCGQIKTGAPCRGERVEKYNQLLRIGEILGERGVFAGESTFKTHK